MESVGIVRRIDDLGRIVLPKEIRRMLRLREGDQMEIYTDRKKEIILTKYSPIRELSALVKNYADVLTRTASCLVCICDMDQVMEVGGHKRKELKGEPISQMLQKFIANQGQYRLDMKRLGGSLPTPTDVKDIRIFQNREELVGDKIIIPIHSAGDTIGAVLFLSTREKQKFTEVEQKLCECAACFLGAQLEQ